MNLIENQSFEGERSLFCSKNFLLKSVTFNYGESPLKESKNIKLDSCTFTWKYPLWYCKNVEVKNSKFIDTSRSGIWYTQNIEITDSLIGIEKTFRRSKNIKLKNVDMPDARESMWKCSDIELENVRIKGDYFGMNSKKIVANSIVIDGNYCFDGGRDIVIKNSILNSKDAIWNCKNVLIENSKIVGEYFGWNSKNVTLKNCTIESLQGFCYMENLTLIDCTLINTTLAFEFSKAKGNVLNVIDSIKNPAELNLICENVKELILEKGFYDPKKIHIEMKK